MAKKKLARESFKKRVQAAFKMEEVPVDPENEENAWTFLSSQTMVLKMILEMYRKTTYNFFIQKKNNRQIELQRITSLPKRLPLFLTEVQAHAKSTQSRRKRLVSTCFTSS